MRQVGLGGCSDHDARRIFYEVDRNRNGRLEYREALRALEKIRDLLY
jgi:hypothetical protein